MQLELTTSLLTDAQIFRTNYFILSIIMIHKKHCLRPIIILKCFLKRKYIALYVLKAVPILSNPYHKS